MLYKRNPLYIGSFVFIVVFTLFCVVRCISTEGDDFEDNV